METIKKCASTSRKVYTPETGILIGEVVTMEDGHLGLRMKKNSVNVYEVVSIDKLLGLVYRAAEETA